MHFVCFSFTFPHNVNKPVDEKSMFSESWCFWKSLPGCLVIYRTYTEGSTGSVFLQGQWLITDSPANTTPDHAHTNTLHRLKTSHSVLLYGNAACPGVLTFYPTCQIVLPGLTAHAHAHINIYIFVVLNNDNYYIWSTVRGRFRHGHHKGGFRMIQRPNDGVGTPRGYVILPRGASIWMQRCQITSCLIHCWENITVQSA